MAQGVALNRAQSAEIGFDMPSPPIFSRAKVGAHILDAHEEIDRGTPSVFKPDKWPKSGRGIAQKLAASGLRECRRHHLMRRGRIIRP